MKTADLFGAALTEIADAPMGARGNLTETLMRRFGEKGLTLEQLSDRRIMKRSRGTLEKNARKFGLTFPDYVPIKLRKTVTLFQKGDFWELRGSSTRDVANLFETVVLGTPDDPMVAFPAHTINDDKAKLKAAFYIVKTVKAKKLRAKRAA